MDSLDDLKVSWHRAWERMGAQKDGDVIRGDLVKRYSAAVRRYHNIRHLRECIEAFSMVELQADRPGEVDMALWFHDAVYDPIRHDNEERSAQFAHSALLAHGVAAEPAARVAELVRATGHESTISGLDARILLDIDLRILGAPKERFIEYESQVRAEYAFVPEAVFWEKRRALLQSFLDRAAIYTTPYFHASHEQQARENIRWSINNRASCMLSRKRKPRRRASCWPAYFPAETKSDLCGSIQQVCYWFDFQG